MECVNILTFGFDGAVLSIVVGAVAGLAGYEIKGGLFAKITAKFTSRIDEIMPVLLPKIPEPYRTEIKEMLEQLKDGAK